MTAEERSKEYVDNYLKNSREFPFSVDCQRKALIKVDLNRVERAYEDGYKQAIKDMITAKENYPIGSDSSDAPWNKQDLNDREIEVLVSITLSKTVKIKVNDYKIIDFGVDEDGDSYEEIDYSECNLNYAVKDQVKLPNEEGWDIDDFEVILN